MATSRTVICSGDGSCFENCWCYCYEDDYNMLIQCKICECGHRSHAGNCPPKKQCIYNCKLIECENFLFCGEKMPKWKWFEYQGLCINCSTYVGKLLFINITAECTICTDVKKLIQLSCGHRLCSDCWKTICDSTKRIACCPFCRKGI